jgi:hypothetical protein
MYEMASHQLKYLGCVYMLMDTAAQQENRNHMFSYLTDDYPMVDMRMVGT